MAATTRGARLVWAAVLVLAQTFGSARAQDVQPLAPSPRAVIYPGDIIRDDMLADIPQDAGRDGNGPFVLDRSFVIGKTARLTLLPGHAIPYAAISSRKLVVNGSEVKLVFAEGDLTIVTSGSALQDGAVGDVVRARNSDSGVTVSGAVQADGSIRVGGG
jgi:flagella basal body P-ring formation protein FlgA